MSYHVATAAQTDPALQGWLADLPKAIRRRLLEIGLIDSERASMSKPLSEHVADFRKALESKGNTAKHGEATCTRLSRIFEECRFTFWPQITGTKVQSFLNGLREGEEKLSPQTFNYYLGSLKSFCRWMVKNRRATTSPVSHTDPLNVKTDRRHVRRALSPDEMLWLLSATAQGEPRSNMTGLERAMLFRVAVETGLRANEIRSLTTASFTLDTDPPTVAVSAAYSSHSRTCFEVNSLPLSERMCPGTPRVAISHASRSSTSSLVSLRSTSMLRHSRVNSSTFTRSRSGRDTQSSQVEYGIEIEGWSEDALTSHASLRPARQREQTHGVLWQNVASKSGEGHFTLAPSMPPRPPTLSR